MAYGFRVELWGDRALFTRPELKAERMSYDVPTPSALRGILEAIYWHPGMRWHIDRIYVLNPISFISVRRNEVKQKASKGPMKKAMLGAGELPHIDADKYNDPRASLLLINVHYVVDAHFELTEDAGDDASPGKFQSVFNRRLEKGQCYSQPYFGCREFPAYFQAYEGHGYPVGFYSDEGEHDFGLMLYDMDYSDPKNITPMFYRAIMRNGVIDVAGSKVLR